MPEIKLPPLISEAAKRLELLGHQDHPPSVDSMSLPIAILPYSQLRTDASSNEKNPWEKSHDAAIEIAATTSTLMDLKHYHGSMVQVRPASGGSSKTHLARLVVTPQGDPGFSDGVLYLSPLLSFNMGLNYHLETLIAADAQRLPANNERVESGKHASTSQRNGFMPLPPRKNSKVKIKVTVSALPQSAEGVRESNVESVPQSGCRPARVASAEEVAFSVIKEPILALLNSQTEAEEHEKEAAQKPPQVPGMDEEKENDLPPFVGEGVPEEAYGTALLEWIRAKPRLVAAGDVVAIPVTEGTHRSGLLKTLYSDSKVRDLLYYRLTSLKPERADSSLLISDRTVIKLEGQGQSAIPPGSHQYVVRSLDLDHESPLAEPQDGTQLREGSQKSVSVPMWKRVAGVLAPALHPARQGVTLRATVLLSGPVGSGKKTAIVRAAEEIGVRAIPFSCQELRAGSDPKTALALRMGFNEAKAFAPAIMLLTDVEALVDKSPANAGLGGAENGPARIAAALQECLMSNKEVDQTVYVLGTTSSLAEVPAPIRRCFTHELVQEAPDASGRTELLHSLLPKDAGLSEEALSSAALSTAGLLPADLRSAVAETVVSAVARKVDVNKLIQQAISPENPLGKSVSIDMEEDTVKIEEKDLENALTAVQKRTATAIGAPQIPNVKWEDVGGLEDVKGAILETVELPLKHPELFSSGLRRRSGLLLYGPPGTGKTLIAKAVATECSINFLSVKGPELINMYIGESERQVREVFERARRARPCVLFFDELDSLAPARGAGADSGGVMDRVVSQLLAEVDGLAGGGGLVSAGSQDVFLIGATNRPDLLDTALMRPGRLDKLLYVGVAQKPEDKLKVLHALTRKFVLSPSVVLTQIANSCPETLTGADLYALCADAWMAGLRRLTASEGYSDQAEDVEVEQNDFELALASLTPSLSLEELARYQTLQKRYQTL